MAVSLKGPRGDHNALLLNVDPRRGAPVIRAARLTLSRTIVHPECTNVTCGLPGRSSTLRIALPQAANVQIEIVEPSGRPTPHIGGQRVVVRAPAGISFVRLLTGQGFTPEGRHFVWVSWRDHGGSHRRLLPVATA